QCRNPCHHVVHPDRHVGKSKIAIVVGGGGLSRLDNHNGCIVKRFAASAKRHPTFDAACFRLGKHFRDSDRNDKHHENESEDAPHAVMNKCHLHKPPPKG